MILREKKRKRGRTIQTDIVFITFDCGTDYNEYRSLFAFSNFGFLDPIKYGYKVIFGRNFSELS